MVSARRERATTKKKKQHDDDNDLENSDSDENDNRDRSDSAKKRQRGKGDNHHTTPQAQEAESSSSSLKKKRKTSRDQPQQYTAELIETPIRRVNPVGKVAEAGVIKKIYVENFMCHRKMTVELCRNVNFIHGQNGSGKSAILAAIQICLGAGARRTHRARNMKELVRKEAGSNCNGARVRVSLWNKGSDAFQHDIYGDEITVERTISLRGGGNTYKLLDKDMKEQSRSKKDLDMLLDQLNIQVENPVAILDQEEAKKFLTGKPEDKYAFFAKATELERMDRSYARVMDNLMELDDSSMTIKNSLTKSKENVKMLQREWEEFQKIDKLEDKLSDLRVKYAWSTYKDFSRKVEEEQDNLNEIEKRLQKRKDELDKASAACDTNEDEEEKLKEKLELLTKEAEEAAETKSKLEMDQKKAMAPLKKLERELSSNKREIQQAKRRLKTAQQHLKEARDEIIKRAGSAKSEEAKRTERLNKAEQELSKAKESINQQTEDVSIAFRKYEELEGPMEQAKSNAESVVRQYHAVKAKLHDLSASENNSLAVFGKKCTALDQKVQRALNAKRFRGKVIGPIGFHIKIAKGKEHLAKIAESTLGRGTLDRFIVTNDADRALFMKLRQEVGCNSRECSVFQTHSGRRYDVPPPPADGIETVASVLHIEDDLVFNCLVDQQKIDQLALANSLEESENSLLIRENGKELIKGRNIKQVFFLPNGDFWQVNNGNRTMISNERGEKGLRQTIGIDRTEAIREAQNELDLINREVNELRTKEKEVLDERKQYKLKWNTANRTKKQTEVLIEKLQNTIEEINAEADAAENVTIDTSEQEEDVRLASDALEEVTNKESEMKNSMESLREPINEIKQKLEEITTRNKKVMDDIDNQGKQLEEFVRNRSQKQSQLEKRQSKVKQAEDAKTKQIEIVKQRSETKEEAFQKARLVTHHSMVARSERNANKNKDSTDGDELQQIPSCEEIPNIESIEPVETDKEPTYYKRRLKNVQIEIEEEKKRKNLSENDPEVALQKFQRAQKDLIAKVQRIEIIEKNTLKLVNDLKERKKKWKKFRNHIADMTNETFDQMLNKKGSSGQIDFDHSNKALNLIVQKDNTDSSMTQTKDVKALSGGERSFVTLSLLLALGENLETPFRVMDEFDVFLDPLSRKIALQTMIRVAKGLEHRQFIFITPQDLSNLPTDPMLKIFCMKPPDRDAQGPAQQTLEFES